MTNTIRDNFTNPIGEVHRKPLSELEMKNNIEPRMPQFLGRGRTYRYNEFRYSLNEKTDVQIWIEYCKTNEGGILYEKDDEYKKWIDAKVKSGDKHF